jgi:hypothetical protein
MTTQPNTTRLRWKTESICSPSHRCGYRASTAAGTFRIVPSDFLPLDDLMAGRSVPSAGFEIRWLSKNSQTQIIARDVASIPEAKTFCKWRLSRLESKTLPATGE